MLNMINNLVSAAEKGNMQRMTLSNTGEQLSGWIMEITETSVILSVGFNETQGKEQTIALSDIMPNSIAYWDAKQSIWVSIVSSNELRL